MTLFHRRFERYVHAGPGFAPELRLFSVKREFDVPGAGAFAVFDAVYCSPQNIFIAPFILDTPDGFVFPEALRSQDAATLERIQRDIAQFVASRGGDDGRQPNLTLSGNDPDLVRLLSAPGMPPVLGLSTYAQVFALYDRYESALQRATLGDVLDAHAGIGDGALLLRHFGRSVDAVTSDEMLRRTAARLGRTWLLSQPPQRTYALAAAHDILPDEAATWWESLHRSAPDGVRIVTASGERGRAALEEFGNVQPVVRVANEASGPTGEWMIVDESVALEAAAQPPERQAISVSAQPISALFVMRPSAAAAFGGDVVQIRQTADALRRRGHRIEITTDPAPVTDGFDVVHLSNLTATMETLEQTRAVREFGGAIVLMPIFIDHADETVWGMEVVPAAFYAAAGTDALNTYLAAIARRQLTVQIPAPPVRTEQFVNQEAFQREIVRTSDLLIANAMSEVHRIYRYLDNTVPFAIAPSAADPQTYGKHARDRFTHKYGLDGFVLSTGRVESRKNQLLLTHALRDLPYPLVLIGSSVVASYGALLRAYRSAQTVVIPHVTEAELAGAYAAARVFAMPSWDEVVSLSSLNAAISETALVLTRNGYEHEYFRDDAEYCDPGDVGSIRDAVHRAWNVYEQRAPRRRVLAQRVISEYSWDQAAEATEQAYFRLLAYNPRGKRRREMFAVRG